MSPPPPAGGREADARVEIDAALETAGWVVQDREEMNLSEAQGVAVREFKLKHGHGYADYLLFVDGKAVGVLEAKAPGHTLIGVEPQSTKYASGLPDGLDPPIMPLPFLYLSTGHVTKFTNLLDPEPRSRFIFHVHRPGTLAEWLSAPTLDTWVKANGAYTGADDTRPSSLRARLRAMPELEPGEGDTDREALVYTRPDFWVTTSNKQLNFVQHVKALLKVHGRAGVVLPDNVLFEGGAGETVRRKLLHECDLHTILRLPTGIFYAQGVKANVLFFDRKPGSDKPWTKKVWVYDHRTNCHYTLKTKTMTRANLDDFVACYRPGDIHNRKQTWSEKKSPEGRWRSFTFDEISARDKCSLDLFWLRDESLEDSASLPEPHVLAQEIADDLRSALGQIEDILGDLEARAAKGPRQPAP